MYWLNDPVTGCIWWTLVSLLSLQAYQQPGNDTVKLVIIDVYWVSHYNSSV